MSSSSRIFVKNRALGYVSNHIPVLARYNERRRENILVTCVGRNFHTYSSIHLTLLNVSGSHPKDITCLAADRFLIYTACGNLIYSWKKGTDVHNIYRGHDAVVHLILPFGNHIISVDDSNLLKMFDVFNGTLYTELQFEDQSFLISTILHPATYINKILLGSEQGQLQLWNVHTRKLIYTFTGWQSGVQVLQQAPAHHVVAVGLADGRIVLHNLYYDRTIMEFSQDWGPVTSISFRTDGPPVMVTGTGAGHILLWDLEKKESCGQMWNAHYAAVTGLTCLPSEPLLITSSPDNSLKIWIFDMPDGTGRLLTIREGHSLPPTSVKFHENDKMLSSGSDSSLRVFSVVTETKNHMYGRATFNKKLFKKQKNKRSPDAPLIMPPIVSLVCEETRLKEWDNIAAVHRGLAEITTWSSDKNCMGDHHLCHPRFKERKDLHLAIATCICLTQCGNFVLVGYSTGHLDRFNMQSGLHKLEYSAAAGRPAHKGAMRGVAAEGLNQVVISGGADCVIKFWNFKEGKLVSKIELTEAVALFKQHKESSLLAVALDNNSISLVDIDAQTVVRRLPSHPSRITDLEFSPDCRWLLVATMDCLIKTWDIPSANLIDVFRTPTPTISLSLNLTGDLLATCHVDNLGVFIWCNKTVHTHISLRPLPVDYEIPLIELPNSGEVVSEKEMKASGEDVPEETYKSPQQLSEELITLSTLATSRWINILDIDLVKKRNKPKQAPSVPKSAPFFLPTTKSLEPEFEIENVVDETRQLNLELLMSSTLSKVLMEDDDSFTNSLTYLKNLGPSSLDAEVLMLAPEGGGSIEVLRKFLDFLLVILSVKKDFELGQTYLALFLKHHGDIVTNEQLLFTGLKNLQSCQANTWENLETKLLFCMSVAQSLKQL